LALPFIIQGEALVDGDDFKAGSAPRIIACSGGA
jgi:hypothetical protein